MVPGTEEWMYVKVMLFKPTVWGGRSQILLAGSRTRDLQSRLGLSCYRFHPHAEISLTGDAMAIFSGGILKSNLHRVV